MFTLYVYVCFTVSSSCGLVKWVKREREKKNKKKKDEWLSVKVDERDKSTKRTDIQVNHSTSRVNLWQFMFTWVELQREKKVWLRFCDFWSQCKFSTSLSQMSQSYSSSSSCDVPFDIVFLFYIFSCLCVLDPLADLFLTSKPRKYFSFFSRLFPCVVHHMCYVCEDTTFTLCFIFFLLLSHFYLT